MLRHYLELEVITSIGCDRRAASDVLEPQFQSVAMHSAFGHYAEGCQPASAHNSPLTAELEIRKQIAPAISSGRISRRS